MNTTFNILKQFKGTAFLWAVMLCIAAFFPFTNDQAPEGLAIYFKWLHHCDASHLVNNLWYTLPNALIIEHRLKTTKYLIFVVAAAILSGIITHIFAEPTIIWQETIVGDQVFQHDYKEAPYQSAGFSGISYAFKVLVIIFLFSWGKENLKYLPYIIGSAFIWYQILYLFRVSTNYESKYTFSEISHIGHISGMAAAVILYITYKSLQKLNQEKEWF